ncbi:hypothetical protein PR202_gb00140 [Eleusine coracana subsp. coracana]|uniref:Uncharacterized protein n=1 Tax=Eleusine coracana subsp. coracana TaxID=191504 RepID=A0AAV5DTJ3_ELECO|nr:hypothetical protein PR202_gb00140 [Eleusine coracana subsp. coracana]
MDSGGRQMEQLAVPSRMVDELVEEALVWCSQHGLVVGDRNHPVRSPCCSLYMFACYYLFMLSVPYFL